MKFTKRLSAYYSVDGQFIIRVTNGKIKGLHPKYSVSKKGELRSRYASTLKEAKEIAANWN